MDVGFFAEQGFEWLIPAFTRPNNTDWDPSANAIYVQMAATVSLALAQTMYHTLKGVTTFGWAVTTFTPCCSTCRFKHLDGWSDNIVSWELGIS